MGTGFRGTFVISWSQTELDGMSTAPVQSLSVGQTWSWRGDAVRVDGPNQLLRLEGANGETVNRKRAARMVRRLVGAAMNNTRELIPAEMEEPLMDLGFVVTDGTRSYTVTIIEVGSEAAPLLMFHDEIPPRGREMWIVHHSLEGMRGASTGPASGGVICFTPGTRIETPEGPRLVEELREGDYVQTRDNGAEEIQWIGSRRMSGARLFAMPKLRPIRLRAGALGIGRPDAELLVSPEHRMLVRGDVARALFNTPEVLVMARDLINNDTVAVDLASREVTYIHLLLPRHQIIWANGVETESFHPASTALSTLDEGDRARLLAINPNLEYEPNHYGGYARRCLSGSEAAILAHEAA
ncbi:Hint domain protein [Roseovarius mucosus]|uniref:Hint domain protein n=1 Tax=Roseovarius mucosus TaxID=215743 RepID=A0A1V0RM24_9RHOB|nr:Hint domain-containing protein [Roseovarius mucosus]ARE82746.1 Hint domain protein [Roseovarius mucosus]